jgi:hypothetical protein
MNNAPQIEERVKAMETIANMNMEKYRAENPYRTMKQLNLFEMDEPQEAPQYIETYVTIEPIIKGGFDRKNLFQQAEQGFDRLFGYNRQLTESFEYYNTMKNGSISEQLNMQERQINETAIQPDIPTLQQSDNKQPSINVPDLGISSAFGLLTPDINKDERTNSFEKKKEEA